PVRVRKKTASARRYRACQSHWPDRRGIGPMPAYRWWLRAWPAQRFQPRARAASKSTHIPRPGRFLQAWAEQLFQPVGLAAVVAALPAALPGLARSVRWWARRTRLPEFRTRK